jgi:hypothetical protein
VEIQAHKAPRMELACMANACAWHRVERILIPHECWTMDGVRGSVVEKFMREKAVFLDAWVAKQYAVLTRDWESNTKRDNGYYWG